MIISATTGLLIGAVIGLKFNVKMIFHATLLAFGLLLLLFLTGKLSAASLVIEAMISAAALQSGFFASLVMRAMGLLTETTDLTTATISIEPISSPKELPEKT